MNPIPINKDGMPTPKPNPRSISSKAPRTINAKPTIKNNTHPKIANPFITSI